MISVSVVVPFQKGPCGEGGRTRGFLLALVEETAVVVLVLLLIFLVPLFFFPSFFLFDFLTFLFAYNTKVNRIKLSKIKKRARKLLLMDGLKERCEWNEKLLK